MKLGALAIIITAQYGEPAQVIPPVGGYEIVPESVCVADLADLQASLPAGHIAACAGIEFLGAAGE